MADSLSLIDMAVRLKPGGKRSKGMAKSKKWIAKATKNARGQFAAKAKAAGKSTAEFAREKANAPGRLGKQARLAKTLMGMNKGGGKSRGEKWYGAKKG